MDYVVVVVVFLFVAMLVNVAIPVLAELLALAVFVGVPVLLCMAIAKGWEIPIEDPTGSSGWQRLAVLAAIAGVGSGLLMRQLTVFAQAEQASSRSDALARELSGLRDELHALQREFDALRPPREEPSQA